MITLKIKYTTDESSYNLIREYRKQYSSVLHYAYNRRFEGKNEKETEHLLSTLNNIDLIKSYLKRCAVKEATQLLKDNKDTKQMIFGGKGNFIKRCKGRITKGEYNEKRLSKLYIIGESNQHANRMIVINEDITSFIFKPTSKTKITLKINGGYKRYKSTLRKLHELQENKLIPITYQLDNEYIYLTYEEAILNKIDSYVPIKNRIFAIDLNPNYVGWSVVDWESSNCFNVIKSGVISTKVINGIDYNLKGKSSNSKEKKYINNKRLFETYEISKLLVNVCKHYKCEVFSIEDLDIKSSDKCKGKKFNRLVNNLWNRNKLVNNLTKRCNLYGITLIKVKANYSSFIGNFLFRDLRLPDMVLSSIELGRRGYEFNEQYIKKEKEIRKNIIFPEIEDFVDRYVKSLEEFSIEREIGGLKEVYEYLKNAKCRYRVSLENRVQEFSRCFSKKSKIKKIVIN